MYVTSYAARAFPPWLPSVSNSRLSILFFQTKHYAYSISAVVLLLPNFIFAEMQRSSKFSHESNW